MGHSLRLGSKLVSLKRLGPALASTQTLLCRPRQAADPSGHQAPRSQAPSFQETPPREECRIRSLQRLYTGLGWEESSSWEVAAWGQGKGKEGRGGEREGSLPGTLKQWALWSPTWLTGAWAGAHMHHR